MSEAQKKILEGLDISVQMEIEGQKYYEKISNESVDKLGKNLFEWLASEENKHRQKFEYIYELIRDNKQWPEIDIKLKKNKGPAEIFTEAKRSGKTNIVADSDKIGTVDKALEMEARTQEFYKSRAENSVYDIEKIFYESLIGEEQAHYLALIDYREFLIDPEGWFLKIEHHSLDGA